MEGRFRFTGRVRPFCEVGVGDSRFPQNVGARWDVSRWNGTQPDSFWASSVHPSWLDITCYVHQWESFLGRHRVTDRFEPGTMTIVAKNENGWADLDPANVTELPMRPGRQIRVGVFHEVLGQVVLWRGFVDAVTPGYDPDLADIVTIEAICALGEVSRQKLPELAAAVGAGETGSARIVRILNAARWADEPRDITTTGVAMIATTLGGQVADMLGQVAESEGGAVYGDLDGRVAYRGRDWQTFDAGTPADNVIGNVITETTPGSPAFLSPLAGIVFTDNPGLPDVFTLVTRLRGPHSDRRVAAGVGTTEPEPGYWIPGTPAVPGYLTPTVGTVTTPDPGPLPNQCVFVCKTRGGPTAGSAFIAGQWPGVPNQAWGFRRFSNGNPQLDYSTDGTATAAVGLANGPPLSGTDDFFALAVTLNNGSGQRVVTSFQSTDGTAWTQVATGTTTPAITMFDSAAVVRIGASTPTGAIWPGRIYWCELRTGLDPAAGTVIWRFDANDYTSGTTWTDPRGRQWTVTNPAAITPTKPAVPPQWVPPVPGGWSWALTRRNNQAAGEAGWWNLQTSDDGIDWNGQAVALNQVSDIWEWLALTVTKNQAGAALYTSWRSNDGTTWAAFAHTTGPPIDPYDSTDPVVIGRYGPGSTWDGEIAWVELRDGGSPVDGTVVWRFDAAEAPLGLFVTSYVDPRGRLWWLNHGGLLGTYGDMNYGDEQYGGREGPVMLGRYGDNLYGDWLYGGVYGDMITPATQPTLADICPTELEVSHRRSDLVTEALLATDGAPTPRVYNDDPGQAIYGFETFEATDLQCSATAQIDILAARLFRTRGYQTAPRVESVGFTAGRGDARVIDLMSTCTPLSIEHGPPTRLRCRFQRPRGPIIDRETFVAGVEHFQNDREWTCRLILDLARPYEIPRAAARWDVDRWNQASWAPVT